MREELVGGHSIVFTLKAVVGRKKVRSSTNVCKLIVSIDASQLYPYALCQAMPTGLYTRWDFDSQRFNPRSSEARFLDHMVMAYFQNSRQNCKIESLHTTGTHKKIILSALMDFVVTLTIFSEALCCFFVLWVAGNTTWSYLWRHFQKTKVNEAVKLHWSHLRQTKYSIREMWGCEWKQNLRQNHEVKCLVQLVFPFKRPVSFINLLYRTQWKLICLCSM